MLPRNLERILDLPDDARVLDVGGWAGPLNRADWVIDLMPYETRGAGNPGGFGPGPERFDRARWIQRDICDREPWPFEDDFFDFVVCTFTLEDVRDPIAVCREMSRVGTAGYVEVPSLLDELSLFVPQPSGGPWVGHMHHRWLVTLEDDELVFVAKWHSLHCNWRVRVPPRWAKRMREEDRVLAHFWEGELRAREREVMPDYPYDELERAIRDRFRPSAKELRLLELRERGRRALARAGWPLRRAAEAALGRLPR